MCLETLCWTIFPLPPSDLHLYIHLWDFPIKLQNSASISIRVRTLTEPLLNVLNIDYCKMGLFTSSKELTSMTVLLTVVTNIRSCRGHMVALRCYIHVKAMISLNRLFHCTWDSESLCWENSLYTILYDDSRRSRTPPICFGNNQQFDWTIVSYIVRNVWVNINQAKDHVKGQERYPASVTLDGMSECSSLQ